MQARLYWIGQCVFGIVFLALATSGDVSNGVLPISALIQLVLVGWRLWVARSWPWLALAPPASTLGLSYGLGLWAAREDAKWGGDGAGLLVGMASLGWCMLAYVVVGVWAGFRPVVTSEPA